MTLTTIVLLVLALYLVQIFLQETSRYRFNLWTIMSNRDDSPEPSVIAARLERAKNNLLESLPAFVALSLLALVNGADTGLATTGAMVFLVARIVYVPVYASGIPVLRSLIWLIAIAGMVMMALALI